MKIILSIFSIVILPINNVFSQLDSSAIIVEDVLDNILIEPDEEGDDDALVDVLEDLMRNKIDLNTAYIIDLSKLPKMDAMSAQRIIDHRNKYGFFYSTNELYAIKELDKTLIDFIMPFIKVDKIKTDEQTDYEIIEPSKIFLNDSRLSIRSRITNDLQTRDGFTNDNYAGSKIKSYNRYLYSYNNQYQLGFTTEKDAGELSYTDFTSFHLQINDAGILNNFVAGDYVLEFGQGLALWSPFGLTKGADAVYPVKRKAKYLRAYNSATEYRFNRGAAAQIVINDFGITAFYSNNTFDANIDSLTNEISSVSQTGFHRTQNEIDKKHSARSNLIGGVLDYRFFSKMNIGVIYYKASFDKQFDSSSFYYNGGDDYNYLSAFYDFNFSKINLFGEASFDGTSVASINGIQFLASSDFLFSTTIRSYPRYYKNFYGFAFSERSGSINNEVGFYSGLKWKLPFGIMNLYYDIFKFPYRTNENSLSSEGNEFLFDFITSPLRGFDVQLRYKHENKEVTELVNINEEIVRRLKQIIRTEFTYNLNNLIRLRTRFEYNHFFVKDAGIKEDGFLMFQDIRFTPQKNINLYGRIIFYQTDSFNSAVYEYENDLLGVMPNLAMYDKGIRWYFIAKYKPLDFLMLSAKYSETYKPDESSLSSGDNEIVGNVDNRISFQIDMNF